MRPLTNSARRTRVNASETPSKINSKLVFILNPLGSCHIGELGHWLHGTEDAISTDRIGISRLLQ
jgi:hypothetical protein